MTAAEFAKLVTVTGRRGEWTDGRCPAHDDQHASLSFRDGDRALIVTCRAGCTVNKIAAAVGHSVRDFSHRNGDGQQVADHPRPPRAGLTVEALAVAKGLPAEFLRSLGVEPDGYAVRITYRLEDGTLAPRQRKRTALAAKDGSVWYPGDGAPVPYGLWRLEDARRAGELLVVEGESDCWGAWYHGLPALGLPGADTAKLVQPEHVSGIARLYVCREPDRGGDTFVRGVAGRLRELGWTGEAGVLTMPDGLKDLNDLHRDDPARFVTRLRAAMQAAEALTDQEAARQPGSAALALTSLADLLREPEDTTAWVVEGRLPAGGLSILAGKPKAGKSTLARCLALAVARGEPWLGCPTVQGPVFYLGLEEKRGEVRAHFRAMGATTEDVRVFIAPSPQDGLAQLRAAVERERPVLIIVDPLFRFVRVKDGNDYATMSNALEPVMGFARATGAHLLVTHHSPKRAAEGGDGILGSTAIFGAVDTALLLKRSDAYRTLSSVQRYGPDLEETTLTLDPVTRLVTAGPSRREADQAAAATAILDYLAGQTEAAEEPAIMEAVEGRQADKRRALRALVEEKKVRRTGAGVRGDPYRYSDSRTLVPDISRVQENEKSKTAASARDSDPYSRTGENALSASVPESRVRETEALDL